MTLPELDQKVLWALALGLGFLTVVQTARLFVARERPRWRIAKHRQSGARGEVRARQLLEAHGYTIAAEQVTGRYELRVDGEPHPVLLRADFLVEKAGRSYIAEVKSGADSARVGNSATRRQLLEYRLAFPVDGILLVDAFAGRIVEIELPGPEPEASTSPCVLWLVALAALAGAALWMLFS